MFSKPPLDPQYGINRFDTWSGHLEPREYGPLCLYDDHMLALDRARFEVRQQVWEEASVIVQTALRAATAMNDRSAIRVVATLAGEIAARVSALSGVDR